MLKNGGLFAGGFVNSLVRSRGGVTHAGAMFEDVRACLVALFVAILMDELIQNALCRRNQVRRVRFFVNHGRDSAAGFLSPDRVDGCARPPEIVNRRAKDFRHAPRAGTVSLSAMNARFHIFSSVC